MDGERTRAKKRYLTGLYCEAVATLSRISRLVDDLDGLEAIPARTPLYRYWMVDRLADTLRKADLLDSEIADAEVDVMHALDDDAAAAAVGGGERPEP